MKLSRLFGVTLLLCAVLISPKAFATRDLISTGYSGGVSAGKVITSAYGNYILPKFPPNATSPISGFSSHFQIHHIDATQYSFLYFNCETVVIFGVRKYKIEITYQNFSSADFHDSILTDYAYPGDSIGWFYTDAGAVNAIRIVNTPASGHTGWDHSTTFSWSGIHLDSYINNQYYYNVGVNFGVPQCAQDMPAQDVPGSSAHVSNMYEITAITLVDGSLVFTGAIVGSSECGLFVSHGTYGPYTYSLLSAYGAG